VKTVTKHVFRPDGVAWLDRVRRCCWATADGGQCSLPEGNRAHKMPDTADQQAEHRRRAGEPNEESETSE
jgi:hypothetical protein